MCPKQSVTQQLLRAEDLLKHDYDHPNRYLIIHVSVWKPEGILSNSEGCGSLIAGGRTEQKTALSTGEMSVSKEINPSS